MLFFALFLWIVVIVKVDCISHFSTFICVSGVHMHGLIMKMLQNHHNLQEETRQGEFG